MHEGDSKDWVQVFHGDATVAGMLQTLLEAEGVPTLVPDQNMRAADWMAIGGGDAMRASLLVPRSAETRARQMIQAREQGGGGSDGR